MYKSIKTYTDAQGLSACFRQWRAKSHCKFLHGYALQVEITFTSKVLDERKWVVDFGGMDEIKRWLEINFDHKTLIAADDPKIGMFKDMDQVGICDLVILPDVGCEAFARYIFKHVHDWIPSEMVQRGVRVEQVVVREHGGNAAVYQEDTNA